MPIYEFECRVCGQHEDFTLKIENRNDVQDCWKCGGPMHHIITPVAGRVYGPAYDRKHDTINRATAALVDIPYKELPKGLRTEIEE